MRSFASATLLVLVTAFCLCAHGLVSAQTSNAETLFKEARSRETALRREIDARKAEAPATPLLARARALIGAYDDMSRLFPRNGYGDGSLWQGAVLAADVFWEFGEPDDRTTALRLFRALVVRYPASSLVKQVGAHTDRLNAAKPLLEERPTPDAAAPVPKQPASVLTAIRREVLQGALRITIALDGEASYHDEQIDGPPRVSIDLQNTRPVEALKDVTQAFPDDVVRQIRVERQVGTRTRVVLDLMGTPPHTTYALYNPYRVVIDFARESLAGKGARTITPPPVANAPLSGSDAAPQPPALNGRGGFSLSRQLGLGVGRVVIDPGHGGHDPGAMAGGLSEADLVLDVGLRLEEAPAEATGR